MSTRLLPRYADRVRMNHWFVALMFVLAALSGLAFFHPSFYFFTALFGGGQWTRILHPFMGVLMTLGFLGLFFRLWRQNLITDADREWRRNAGRMMRGDKAGMPPAGKYNYGQKAVFWLMTLSLLVMLITGVMFWEPWFTPYFSIGLMLIAALGFYLQSVSLLMVDLFLMGTQSAFFGPVKYSILPDHLDEDELIGGNAIVEAGTFLSILLGTIIGGILIMREGGMEIVYAIIVAMAALG